MTVQDDTFDYSKFMCTGLYHREFRKGKEVLLRGFTCPWAIGRAIRRAVWEAPTNVIITGAVCAVHATSHNTRPYVRGFLLLPLYHYMATNTCLIYSLPIPARDGRFIRLSDLGCLRREYSVAHFHSKRNGIIYLFGRYKYEC